VSLELSKICWLVHKNDLSKLKRIIKTNQSYWGGTKFIIIPFFNNNIDNIFKRILSIYDPDFIISFDNINPTLRKKVSEISCPIEIIEKFKEKKQFYYLRDIYTRLDRGNKVENIKILKDSSVPKSFENFFNIVYPPKEIKRLLSNLNIGIDEVDEDIFEYLSEDYFEKIFSPKIKSASFWTPDAKYKSPNIQQIKKKLLKKDEDSRFGDFVLGLTLGDTFNVIFGDAKSVEDISLFWNLRVFCRSNNVVWFPKEELKNKDLINNLLKNQDFTKKKATIKDWQVLSIFSYSSTTSNLNKFSKQVNLLCKSLIKNRFSVLLNEQETISYQGIKLELNNYMYDIIFEDKEGHIIPRNIDFLDHFFNFYSLINNIDLHRFNLPKKKELLPLVVDDKSPFRKNLDSRISNTGIRKLYDENIIHIKEPDSFEVIKTLLKTKGIDIKISDKGHIANKLIFLLGGLNNCNVLLDPEIIFLIRNMVNKKNEPVIENLNNIKKFFKKNTDKIKKLLELGILFRGYNLKCKDCNTLNWISIDKLSEKIHCDGCLSKMNLPVNIELSYKLNSLVVHSLNQGALTHIITLLKMKSRSNIYIPGVILEGPFNRELDLIIVNNEGFIISECKNNAKDLKNAEYDSIKHIAEKINAKVCFGSLYNDFSKSIKSKDNDVIFIDTKNKSSSKRQIKITRIE
jgi:hypothetical protein